MYCILFVCLFVFSSTSLLLPTHLPPPSCTNAQSCNPMDFSPPDSPVHGFFQARILEWVAISSSTVTSSYPRLIDKPINIHRDSQERKNSPVTVTILLGRYSPQNAGSVCCPFHFLCYKQNINCHSVLQ